jgi:hypothetical protein
MRLPAVLALPAAYRRRLRTSNAVERLNEEVRRRERVIRIFPTRESVIRLLGALLMEQDEVWTTGKRYFDMTAYRQWREKQPQQNRRQPTSIPLNDMDLPDEQSTDNFGLDLHRSSPKLSVNSGLR